MAHARSLADSPIASLEETILPSLAGVLDGVIEAASLARPGADAAAHAEQLRALAEDLGRLTWVLEAFQPDQPASARRANISA